MYSDLHLTEDRPVYIQVKDYLKRLMLKGGLQPNQKLPSTRELSTLMKVSRSTIILAYAELEDEGLIYALKGKAITSAHSWKRRRPKHTGSWTGTQR